MTTVAGRIVLTRSRRPGKKWSVLIRDGNARTRTVHFGQLGASDYTLHKDAARKARYIQRHRSRETWTRRGIRTAGFWSRWLLWNKPSLRASIRDTERRFGIRIVIGARSALTRSSRG